MSLRSSSIRFFPCLVQKACVRLRAGECQVYPCCELSLPVFWDRSRPSNAAAKHETRTFPSFVCPIESPITRPQPLFLVGFWAGSLLSILLPTPLFSHICFGVSCFSPVLWKPFPKIEVFFLELGLSSGNKSRLSQRPPQFWRPEADGF